MMLRHHKTTSRFPPPTSSPSLPFLSSSSAHAPNRVTLHFKISSSSSSSSSHKTIQIDGEIDEINSRTAAPTSSKKKRKPRPSFSDQIRDKWGAKTVSLREKFPWQERQKVKLPFEEEEEEDGDGDEEDEGTQFVGESRIGDDSFVGDSVSFGPGNRIKVAPWVQERKPRKAGGGKGNGFSGNVEKVVFRGIVEGKEGGNDGIGSGFLEKKENFAVKMDERGLLSRNGSKNEGKYRDFKGFIDEFDSDKLPLEGGIGLRKRRGQFWIIGQKDCPSII